MRKCSLGPETHSWLRLDKVQYDGRHNHIMGNIFAFVDVIKKSRSEMFLSFTLLQYLGNPGLLGLPSFTVGLNALKPDAGGAGRIEMGHGGVRRPFNLVGIGFYHISALNC